MTPGKVLARLADIVDGPTTETLTWLCSTTQTTQTKLLDLVNEARDLVADAQYINTQIDTLRGAGYTEAVIDLTEPDTDSAYVGRAWTIRGRPGSLTTADGPEQPDDEIEVPISVIDLDDLRRDFIDELAYDLVSLGEPRPALIAAAALVAADIRARGVR